MPSSSSVVKRAQDARLRLAAQAEQDEIVTRQDRVDDLRHDGVVVADDAGKERLAAPELVDQVLAHFVLHAAPADGAAGDGRFQLSERGWTRTN